MVVISIIVMAVASHRTRDKKSNAGREINGESFTGKEDEKPQDKRYITKPLGEGNMSDKASYDGISDKKLEWYIKRDENHGASGCDETVKLADYNAIYLGNKDEKTVYLTIDCGYDNGLTAGMLDVLKKEDVPVCFFVTQTYIRDNIDLIKRMKEEGHQVGNHTVHHSNLIGMSYEGIIDELDGCYDYMREATGYDMDPYFRPPCGEYSERVLAIARDRGYKTIFWSMAYYDYDVNKQPGCEYVINHFEKYYHDGAIILMHNVSTSNAQALETVISNLKAKGYRFASLNELE